MYVHVHMHGLTAVLLVNPRDMDPSCQKILRRAKETVPIIEPCGPLTVWAYTILKCDRCLIYAHTEIHKTDKVGLHFVARQRSPQSCPKSVPS